MSILHLIGQEVQAANTVDAFGSAIEPILNNIINPIIELMFALAIVVFAYGIFEMLSKGGDPEARSKGKMHMVGGVIGMFIMVSAWGIINIISATVFQFN